LESLDLSFFEELKRRNVFRVGAAYVIAAWLILQFVGVLHDILTVPEWLGKTVLVSLIVGLPLALIFAWVFELTPSGIMREHEVARTASVRHQTGKKLDRVIIGVLTVALVYILLDKLVLEPLQDAELVEATRQSMAGAEVEPPTEPIAAESIDKSIAVLPFVNMSDDAGNEYFSDGISEELLNLLAGIPELRVIARTSSFAYKGKDVLIADVARELGVAYVLEGSVRKSGDQIRITAQLIRADDSSHLWSESYDRTLNDIFVIQDEIAATVVSHLKIKLLGPTPTVETTDTAAYSLYLRARYMHHQLTPDALDQSIAFYEEALAINPRYVAAWTGLAGAYPLRRFVGVDSKSNVLKRSRDAANKALELDPSNASAHAALGVIANVFDRDLAAAARHYQRALELEPANPEVLIVAIEMARALDRSSDAIAIGEYLGVINPVSPLVASNLGWSYLNAGQLDEAIELFQRSLNLSPGFIYSHMGIGWALLLRGEPESALTHMQLESVEWIRLTGLALTYYALGEESKSDAALTTLIDKYQQKFPVPIAWVFAYRGEADRSFEWLNRAVANDSQSQGLAVTLMSRAFDNLHDDPRWLPFLDRIGMSPAQLDAIEFNVTLPE
jgi:TolB-like protein